MQTSLKSETETATRGFGATQLFLLNLKFCICKISFYEVFKSKLVQFCLLSLQLLSQAKKWECWLRSAGEELREVAGRPG